MRLPPGVGDLLWAGAERLWEYFVRGSPVRHIPMTELYSQAEIERLRRAAATERVRRVQRALAARRRG